MIEGRVRSNTHGMRWGQTIIEGIGLQQRCIALPRKQTPVLFNAQTFLFAAGAV